MAFRLRTVLVTTLCVICINLFNAALLQAVIIDRIAGVIDDEIITYRSVLIEKTFKLSVGSDREVLQKIIDRRLLLKEAGKFKITETAEDIKKVQQALQDLKESLGEERFANALREYELREANLLGLIKDRIIVERFIDFRINFFSESDRRLEEYLNRLRRDAKIVINL